LKTTRAIREGLAGNARGVNGSRHADTFRWALITGALVLGLAAPGAGSAEELVLAGASEAQKPVLSWETRAAGATASPLSKSPDSS